MNYQEIVAQDLLTIKAVTLNPTNPYTWASGMRSPIYCDNRLTMSFPEVRQHIIEGLANLVRTHYPDCQVVAGTATAGIPHAAWLAQALNLPMIYVRSKPKDHGQGKQIEGQLLPGQKVVMVEDLISTGGSVLEASKAVVAAGGEVLGVVAIFNYLLPASLKKFEEAGFPLATVTNYDTLLKVAQELTYISLAEKEILTQWKQNPQDWYANHFHQ